MKDVGQSDYTENNNQIMQQPQGENGEDTLPEIEDKSQIRPDLNAQQSQNYPDNNTENMYKTQGEWQQRQQVQANTVPGAVAYYIPQEAPKKKMGAGKIILIIVACVVVLSIFTSLLFGVVAVASFSTVSLGEGGFSMLSTPPMSSFSVIDIQGEISYSSYSYNHSGTLDYIEALSETENDRGILLFMNTPGGGVYESAEIYQALQDYREETGRPVWVYMGPICASGGYYASAASERIVANQNTTTGSIGVYIVLQDTSGLYDMLGVETMVIKAGENKGAGLAGAPISDDQRAMYQTMVDQNYDDFVSVVENGRGMSHEQALTLADGSIYTANQAVENGLIDDIGNWEDTLEAFEEKTGATAYYPNVSQPSYVQQVFSSLQELMPKSGTEALLNRVEAVPQGVPLAYATELADMATRTELVG